MRTSLLIPAMDAWFAQWVRRHHQDVDTLVDDSELPLAERLIQTTQRAVANRRDLAIALGTEASIHAAALGQSSVIIPKQVLDDLGLRELGVWSDILDTALFFREDVASSEFLCVIIVWGKEAIAAKHKEIDDQRTEKAETLKRDQAQREFEQKWLSRAGIALVSIVVVAFSVIVAESVRR